ncbi:hypothetical protein HK096_002345, partial [Nowakowskiella sp. JEL0078]
MTTSARAGVASDGSKIKIRKLPPTLNSPLGYENNFVNKTHSNQLLTKSHQNYSKQTMPVFTNNVLLENSNSKATIL